jgi:hypothetical protein
MLRVAAFNVKLRENPIEIVDVLRRLDLLRGLDKALVTLGIGEFGFTWWSVCHGL